MIYLDCAATTRMDPEVIEVMTRSLREDFANPGTVYGPGLDARRRVEEAREEMARCLRLPSTYNLVFTSGGSESNNLFIKGTCFPDRRAACLGLEHPSVTATLEAFSEYGNPPLKLLDYQREGRLDPAAVSRLREERVRLLCLSHINNELGVVESVPEVARALRAESPQTRLFVDGVQAAGKWRYDAAFWEGISGYSLSAHKFNGPKGIGLLAYEARLNLKPLIHGGGQQYGVRSGTLPVPLVVGMAHALKRATDHLDRTLSQLERLYRRLVEGLRELERTNPDLRLRFNSLPVFDARRQSPAICNFSFPPVEGEVLLHHLEAKGIYVGLGSACSAHSKEPSKILLGSGCTVEEALCSLRVSFDRFNREEEVDQFLREFNQAYRALYPTFRAQVAHR